MYQRHFCRMMWMCTLQLQLCTKHVLQVAAGRIMALLLSVMAKPRLPTTQKYWATAAGRGGCWTKSWLARVQHGNMWMPTISSWRTCSSSSSCLRLEAKTQEFAACHNTSLPVRQLYKSHWNIAV